MNIYNKYEEKAEEAEKIIIEDEWNDIEVIRYNPTCIFIKNYRTGKQERITLRDTAEDITKAIEETCKEEK